MDVKTRFDQVVAAWSLLDHPFYRAWSEGTLPRQALADYAREYGAFIATLPQGWTTLGDEDTADEERDHVQLWSLFAAELGADVGDASIPAVRDLVTTTATHFSRPETALGALYAFEVQQPATATSKLEGLRSHYPVGEPGQRYFEVHTRNHHEAAKIAGLLADLDPGAQERARVACEETARALWNALSGIYPGSCSSIPTAT